MNKTAIVFGATGLVGSELVYQLIKDIRYKAVKVFTRRSLNIEHIKVIEEIVDVEKVEDYGESIRGDDLFICLGTTRRKAGSVKRMEDIDHHLPVKIARAALLNGVKNMAVVSSISADPGARNYYYRIKGNMEKDLMGLDFNRMVILRPSILLGRRDEIRILESIGRGFIKAFGFLLNGKNRKYRAINAADVAYAMVREINNLNGKEVYESDELAELADKSGE